MLTIAKQAVQFNPSNKGFSLVELMVVVAILVILVTLSIPSFTAWVANTKVRTMAESVQNGLRLAQTEAVRRGVQVQFILTNDSPITKDVTASDSGKNWIARAMSMAAPANSETFIQGTQMVTADDTTNTISTTASTVTFNSLGRVISPAATDVTYDLSNSRGDRPLRVLLNFSGKIRMCDTKKTLSADAPDGCPS